MESYFYIGEVAKLFHIKVCTLRYYDRIGLIHPAYTDPQTKYRYYSIEQFEELNFIRYLRTQGISLEEIREAMFPRDPLRMRELFAKQEERVDQQITALENTKQRLRRRQEQIDSFMDESLIDKLRIKEEKARPVVMMEYVPQAKDNLEMPLRKLERSSGLDAGYFLGKTGLITAKEDLLAGRFGRYRALLCLVEPGEMESGPTKFLPAGRWAAWRFRGLRDRSAEQYARMLQEMTLQGLEPAGDGVELTLMDYGFTEDREKFITEIQIPVKNI